MDKIEKIRQEIERRIKKYATDVTIPIEVLGKVIFELKGINSFLFTLESEKTLGLEEAANKWGLENQEGFCTQSMKVAAFIAGAEWQKEQKRSTLDDPFLYGDWDKELLNEIHSWLGHLDGKYTPYSIDDIKHTARHFVEWQKEQMLKDAVKGYVNYYEDSGGILMAEAQVGCPYHNGDKVRIVVLKEEE